MSSDIRPKARSGYCHLPRGQIIEGGIGIKRAPGIIQAIPIPPLYQPALVIRRAQRAIFGIVKIFKGVDHKVMNILRLDSFRLIGR